MTALPRNLAKCLCRTGLHGRLGAALATAFLVLSACTQENGPAQTVQGGDPRHGMALIRHYGCGSCHLVPGIAGADGLVGPPLIAFSRRVYLAGVLRNTPENLVTWIRWPQRIIPGNAMPEMGLSDQEARDVAAYLYTIR